MIRVGRKSVPVRVWPERTSGLLKTPEGNNSLRGFLILNCIV